MNNEKLEAWLPMEMAPKDGTDILVVTKTMKMYVVLYRGGEWLIGNYLYAHEKQLLGWQLLPKPPISV